MTNKKAEFVRQKINEFERTREDLSPYLIHLTRDTEDGKTARENLYSILSNGIIEARKPDTNFPINSHTWENFKVLSFTETPLAEIPKLTKINVGKAKNFQPYGIVFKKNFIVSKGGNPVAYVYQEEARAFLDDLFQEYNSSKVSMIGCGANHQSNTFTNFEKIAPFFKFVSDTNNFTWEREWKIIGNFHFRISDVEEIIVPNEQEAEWFRDALGIYSYQRFCCIEEEHKSVIFDRCDGMDCINYDDFLSPEQLQYEYVDHDLKIIIDKEGNFIQSIFKDFTPPSNS